MSGGIIMSENECVIIEYTVRRLIDELQAITKKALAKQYEKECILVDDMIFGAASNGKYSIEVETKNHPKLIIEKYISLGFSAKITKVIDDSYIYNVSWFQKDKV
jgi:hypothetical protein